MIEISDFEQLIKYVKLNSLFVHFGEACVSNLRRWATESLFPYNYFQIKLHQTTVWIDLSIDRLIFSSANHKISN